VRRPKPFSQRVVRQDVCQFAEVEITSRQAGLEVLLLRGEPLLGQPRYSRLYERLVCEVRIGRTTPESKRLVQSPVL
jgi:hypothetical protein